jgi:hypothetical protein
MYNILFGYIIVMEKRSSSNNSNSKGDDIIVIEFNDLVQEMDYLLKGTFGIVTPCCDQNQLNYLIKFARKFEKVNFQLERLITRDICLAILISVYVLFCKDVLEINESELKKLIKLMMDKAAFIKYNVMELVNLLVKGNINYKGENLSQEFRTKISNQFRGIKLSSENSARGKNMRKTKRNTKSKSNSSKKNNKGKRNNKGAKTKHRK